MTKPGPKSKKIYTQYGNLKFDLNFFHSRLEDRPNGCLEWTGARHRQGYGMCGGRRIHDDKKIMTVTHRIAMMEKLGRELTRDDYVVHTCGNPLCCRPEHLKTGSVDLRTAELQRNKLRGITDSGLPYNKRGYKWTESEVRWIRSASNIEIAVRYNMTSSEASTIRTNLFKSYLWVK